MVKCNICDANSSEDTLYFKILFFGTPQDIRNKFKNIENLDEKIGRK